MNEHSVIVVSDNAGSIFVQTKFNNSLSRFGKAGRGSAKEGLRSANHKGGTFSICPICIRRGFKPGLADNNVSTFIRYLRAMENGVSPD